MVPQLKNQIVSITLHQLRDLKNACESESLIQAAKLYHIKLKFKYHADYSDLTPLELNHNLDGFLELYVNKNREAQSVFDFFSKAGKNHANLIQGDFDKLLEAAITKYSSHARFQVYRRLAQYINDNNIIIPIFYMDHGSLMRKCLSGISEDFMFNPFQELPNISKPKFCI